jgi:hypothetical protein
MEKRKRPIAHDRELGRRENLENDVPFIDGVKFLQAKYTVATHFGATPRGSLLVLHPCGFDMSNQAPMEAQTCTSGSP